jgi:serine/threonine protein kinase
VPIYTMDITPTTENDDLENDDLEASETKQSHLPVQFNRHIPLCGDANYNTMWQGTAAWMAPEVMLTNNYGFKADVYSFGIVMYELLTCRKPWTGPQYAFAQQIGRAVLNGERPSINDSDLINAPKEYLQLLNQCWETDPMKRPTFGTVFQELKEMWINHM